MTNTQPPVTGNTPQPTITPEVGKRYVTRGGWVTPPIVKNKSESYPFVTADGAVIYTANGRNDISGRDDEFDLISEYVEPTATTDTFRRDLIARMYVAMVASSVYQHTPYPKVAKEAILLADTLIEAMEGEV